MKAYQPIVCGLVRETDARQVLDMPSGSGWLAKDLNAPEIAIDGIDLFDNRPGGYRNFMQADLDDGIPASLGQYDMIVSCEGFEHIANPGLILKTALQHLKPGGTLVITTPNTWHAASRLKMLLRGFYPGFPAIPETRRGMHMHIMPWSWPQLHLHLSLAGFTGIRLHPCFEEQRIRLFDRLMAIPLKLYCRKYARRAGNAQVKEFWETAASPGSLYAQRMVVSAKAPG